MKKIFRFLLTFTLILSLMAVQGCATRSAGQSAGTEDSAKLTVIASIFPLYDWTREIAGEDSDVEIRLLQQNGTDMHSYQPSAADLIAIAECDLFIYVGGESDEWVKKALEVAGNPDRIVLSMMDILGDQVYEEELVEGMEAHDHQHEDGEEHAEEHDHDSPAYDEHVWLSLRNAVILVRSISEALCTLKPESAVTYRTAQRTYQEALAAMDARYEAMVQASPRDTLLFADRFPFRYLTEDYHLNYYAAFAGCSAETEASFETVRFLSEKVDELELDTVLTIEGTTHKIAETVVSTAHRDPKILALDSMQSITDAQLSDGTSYLSLMEKNLEVLKEALQ